MKIVVRQEYLAAVASWSQVIRHEEGRMRGLRLGIALHMSSFLVSARASAGMERVLKYACSL